MATKFRRPMLVLGTTILIMQTVLMPVGTVYAETTMDTNEQELVELPLMKNYLEEEQISDPRFFFTRSRMQGTTEEPLQVTFFSDQEVSETRVFLPEEATLLKDLLPTGISVEAGVEPNEWIVQSKRAQNTFVLPLVFGEAGNYEISVEETTAHLEISEQEETREEVPVEEMESSEDTPVGQEELEEDEIAEQENEQPEEEVSDPVSEAPQEQQTDEASKVVEPTIFDGEVAEVSRMAQFREAVANPEIGIISVQANLSENAANILRVDRPLLIQGNGYTLTFGNNGFYFQLEDVEEDSTLRIENATLTKVGVTPLLNSSVAASSKWTVELETIREVDANTMSLAVVPEGTIVFTGGVSNFTRTASTTIFIQAKEVQAINQAQVTISRGNAAVFFSPTTVSNPQLIIGDGAVVNITTAAGTTTAIHFHGENPEIMLMGASELRVSTIGPSFAIAPTAALNNTIALAGQSPKLAISGESRLFVQSTLSKRGIHLAGSNPQVLVEDSELTVISESGATLNLAGENPRFSAENSTLQLRTTTGQRLNLVGAEPIVTLKSSQLIMRASRGRGILLQGETPQLLLNASELTLSDTNTPQGIILSGADALLSLSNQSDLTIIGSGTLGTENIQIGNNNARPELSVAGGSKLSVRTSSGTDAATDTVNNALHLHGSDPKATIEGKSELSIAVTLNARRGMYLNGNNAELTILDSQLDITTVSGQTLNLTGISPKMTMNKSKTTIISTTGASQGIILSGTEALVSLSDQSEVDLRSYGTGTSENIQIGNNNARPELSVTGGSKLSVRTSSGTDAATDTVNNALHLHGSDPKATIEGKSELSIAVTLNARRGMYLNGNNAELTILDSQLDITTVSGQTLNLTGISPKITMDKSELALQSTTGQRMNLIGSNPVLNLENSQLDMKATTGRGIYLQGATPQVFMENSQLLMTDTGASQGMILQGTDALLSLSNKSELSIIGAGTGTAENIQIGNNNARPELLVAGESKVSVTTTSGTEAATDTANNAIHLRGADPKATFNNAELYIEILSGARRGLVMNGGGGKIDIVSDSNFEVNTNDAYSLALFDDSNKIFIDGKATKVNLLSKFTAGGNTDSTLYTGANSLVNTEFIVDNGAELNVFANNSIAILLQGQGTNFTIQGNSSVVAKNNQTSELMATVRFMHAGNANFIIDNASINIEKEGGAAPGLRLLGSDNHVQVRNGGTFFLNNKGSGNPSDGNVNSNGNQGVQLTEGNETSFSVTDPGSQAIIIAGSGPAIDLSGTGKVRNSNGGYFEAVGRTATASGGIFRAGVLDVEFDNPLFMDFTNRRPGGGNIFSVANGSNLKATNSDLAVWKNGSNLDGDPDLNFPTLDFSFSGTNFNTLGVTNQPDVLNTGNFGTTGLTAYSRLSSNNARWAIADELRVPTNADKKIYGHVSIPVGLKEKRSAWEGEAAVTIEVERVDGRKIDYTAKTVGHSNEKPGISIYGEEPRTGLFEVNLEERLQKGDKVKIKEVRLTSGELTQGYENIILTDTIEVFPIIPPPPATFSSSIIAQDSTTIQGMTDNLDAEVTATHNGEPLNTESVTIDADGRFTIDLSEVSLEMDDKIQVFIRDAEGSALEAGVINPPETNNTRGNINPSTELTFHDVTFKSATTLIVGELGPVLPVDPLDPEVEVNPENKPLLPEDQGQLSIDFVSSFNFGSQAISVYDQTYYAQPQRLLNEDGTVNVTEERPNYVQISDRRPENERNGWELAVTQNNQFTDRQGNQLKGARLLLNNQQFASVQESGEPILRNQDGAVLIPEQKMPLVTAHDGQEAGTWIYRLGDGESAGESVALEVPPTADPRATTYQTTLIWELSAVPDN